MNKNKWIYKCDQCTKEIERETELDYLRCTCGGNLFCENNPTISEKWVYECNQCGRNIESETEFRYEECTCGGDLACENNPHFS